MDGTSKAWLALILRDYSQAFIRPILWRYMAREMHKYYFYHWDESTGDKLDHWGTSDWYFEVGEDEYVSKVIQVFASGNALFYSETHIEDEYGFLSEGKFELIGEEKEISKAEFEKILNNTKFTNVVGAI